MGYFIPVVELILIVIFTFAMERIAFHQGQLRPIVGTIIVTISPAILFLGGLSISGMTFDLALWGGDELTQIFSLIAIVTSMGAAMYLARHNLYSRHKIQKLLGMFYIFTIGLLLIVSVTKAL